MQNDTSGQSASSSTTTESAPRYNYVDWSIFFLRCGQRGGVDWATKMTEADTSTDQLRILLVEDDAIVARAIARLLRTYASVQIVATCRDALAAIEAENAQSLIVDAHLPDGSGLAVLEAWGAQAARPALVLTGADEPEIANRAFLLGARYARKPVRADVLETFARMASASGREGAQRREVVVSEWQRGYRLTRSEALILRLAANGTKRGDLAAATQTSVRTVDTHITNLLRKTGDGSLSEAVNRLLRG